MRHRVDHRKLNRTASHRKAMLCNMVTSLFDNERITTTDAKAKEARRLAERLITRARKGYNAHQEGRNLREAGKDDEAREMEAVALAHWRQAGRYVRKVAVLRKLFEEIAPQFLERDGGYTRIVKLSRRLGDNARTVLLELVDTEKTAAPIGKKVSEEASPEKEEKTKSTKEKKETKAKTKSKAKGKSKAKTSEKAETKDKSESKAKSKSKTKAKSKSKSKSKKKED
jgi:large subunit ribosomal protein L17